MTENIHDAKPGDIYIDEDDRIWRVIAVCREPSVTVEAVEPGEARILAEPRADRERRSGAVSGLMWNGFKRIHRPDAKAPKN